MSAEAELPARDEPPIISRRSSLRTLGLACASLLASSASSHAFLFSRRNSDVPVVKVKTQPGENNARDLRTVRLDDLPPDWVRMQGRLLASYAHFINSLKLRNISTGQFIAAHAKRRGNVWNSLPPREWWNRMGYTLRVVDRISTEMRVPVREIVSAYRSPAYNARCGGRRGSWHQANAAVDVKFETGARQVTAFTRHLRDRGLFKGGVGGYGSFTHIDTRGVNINWGR